MAKPRKWMAVALLIGAPFILLLSSFVVAFVFTKVMGHSQIGFTSEAPIAEQIRMKCAADRLGREFGSAVVFLDERDSYVTATGDAGIDLGGGLGLRLNVEEYEERDAGWRGAIGLTSYTLATAHERVRLTPEQTLTAEARLTWAWRELEAHCGVRRRGPITCTAVTMQESTACVVPDP